MLPRAYSPPSTLSVLYSMSGYIVQRLTIVVAERVLGGSFSFLLCRSVPITSGHFFCSLLSQLRRLLHLGLPVRCPFGGFQCRVFCRELLW
jgi:hypothetical protein